MTCCCIFFQAEDGIRDSSVTGVQTCALPIFDRRLDDVGPERRTVRHVQSSAPGFRKAGAGGRDDRGVGHGALPLNDFPSAPSLTSSGAGSHTPGTPCGFFAIRRMERTTL